MSKIKENDGDAASESGPRDPLYLLADDGSEDAAPPAIAGAPRELGASSLASAVERLNPGFHGPVVSKDPARQLSAASRMSILSTVALMGGGMPYMGSRGEHRGECRKPKTLNNDPSRAKGMRPFVIDGLTIYAGTLRAAQKLARLLRVSDRSGTPQAGNPAEEYSGERGPKGDAQTLKTLTP